MRIMIIGSDGYLGTALVGALWGQHDLNLVDSCLWGQTPSKGVYVPRGPQQLMWHIEHHRPEVLVFLAALAHDPQARLAPAHVHYANAVLPAMGAKWALENGRRFVGISSYSIFTRGPDPGAYPVSKRKMEEWLTDSDLWRGINLVRFGTLFGATGHSRPETFRPHLLLNSMMLDAVTSGKISIPETELQRPVTSLKDAVEAVRRAIEAPVPGSIENVHLCSGTLREFAEVVAMDMPGITIQTIPASKETDKRSYHFAPTIKDALERLRWDLRDLREFTALNGAELMARRQSCWEPMLLRAGAFYAK
jgi:nucleoside-diphosphate-sugar epimerase